MDGVFTIGEKEQGQEPDKSLLDNNADDDRQGNQGRKELAGKKQGRTDVAHATAKGHGNNGTLRLLQQIACRKVDKCKTHGDGDKVHHRQGNQVPRKRKG